MAVRDIIQAAGGSAATTAATYVEDVFSTYLYTGTGASQTITNGIDLATKGGLVWIKCRSNAQSHGLFDTARGTQPFLSTDLTASPTSDPGTGSYNSNGFTLSSGSYFGGSGSGNGYTYASWTFRKQAKFFDVVTYTGTGSATTIAHSLGVTPGMIIVKRTDAAADWRVWHKSNGAGTNGQKELKLNTTDALLDQGNFPSAPTSSSFSVGTYAGTNASGGTYVAYLFADSNSGGFGAAGTDSVVACGSFTGDASGNATVSLGWEPQFVLVKNATGSDAWRLYDNIRGMAHTSGRELRPNASDAEYNFDSFKPIVPKATGFDANNIFASDTYIYLAIRRGPMKTPTDATKVFAPVARTGTGAATSVTGIGFAPDAVISADRPKTNSASTSVIDKLRGNAAFLVTNTTGAEGSDATEVTSFNNVGISLGASNNALTNYYGDPYIHWLFRRAPGFFDVVCYKGGTGPTISHNLGIAPELMIVKRRDVSTGNWIMFAGDVTKSLLLNTTAAVDTASAASYWNNTNPTSTQFSVGGNAAVNNATSNYVAYLFATCPGVSKVFNFTGNGSSQTINCGFASGARFVLIKRTDAAGDWWVYDSARGIVSAADPALKLNSTAAEVTSADAIDPDSSGFIVNQETTCNVNVNNATYIGLAIA